MARKPSKRSGSAGGPVQEEFDLRALVREKEFLDERLREMERTRSSLAVARREADQTLPPSSLLAGATTVSVLGARASKLQERSLRRQQSLGILWLILFSIGSAVLLWWAFRLKGG
jgi:hypothetical protein